MKYIKNIFAIAFIITLTSCNFTENIYINEDGSGKFSLDMDGSSLMAMIPEDSLKTQKVMDSTFSFKQLLEEKKEFLFSMTTDFKSVSNLQDAMSSMNDVQSMSKNSKKELPGGGFGNNGSELKYSFDGKIFTRKATVLKKEILEVEKDSMEQAMNMFFESSSYTVKYHFPKKVKKVSNATALYSEDRKTITIEFPFKDYMKEPEKLNLEVEFE